MDDSLTRKFWKTVEIAKALQPSHSTGRCFHITSIYDKNRVIAIGMNNYKSHPKANQFRRKEIWSDYLPSIHSELSAIMKLGEESCSKYTFFNVRINRCGEVASSRPCSGCGSLLAQVGFNKLFYSTGEDEGFEQFFG